MSISDKEDHLLTPTEENSEVSETKEAEEGDEQEQTRPDNNDRKQKTSSTMTQSGSDRVAKDSKTHRRAAQITEENIILKKQLKRQEERIKILATKLIRVISERSNKTKREEILLEEQKARIADLEHDVSNLREKLHVTKQQLSSCTKLIPHPPSRQASMLSSSTGTCHSKPVKKPKSARSSGSHPARPSTASSSTPNLLDKNFADRVEELLLEAKAENQALEDQLKNCRDRLAAAEEELERTREAIKSKEVEHQEEILAMKSQSDKEQDNVRKRKQLSDNIQLIRLQRESRRTASWLVTLEAQCKTLQARLGSTQETAHQLETQLEETQEELGKEQQKNITLQQQMEEATSSLNHLKELEAQTVALLEENKILREANESLLKKAFAGISLTN